MPAPKGHPPYPGCEKGGQFGYLGRGPDKFTDAEIQALGEGLIDWIKKDGNIWIKYYFLLLDKPILWNAVLNLAGRHPKLAEYIQIAKSIQEAKLLSEPYDHRKKKDGYHARWMLARHHKGEWEDKPDETTQEDKEKLEKTHEFVSHLQKLASSALNIADNNINNADKSA